MSLLSDWAPLGLGSRVEMPGAFLVREGGDPASTECRLRDTEARRSELRPATCSVIVHFSVFLFTESQITSQNLLICLGLCANEAKEGKPPPTLRRWQACCSSLPSVPQACTLLPASGLCTHLSVWHTCPRHLCRSAAT